MKNFLKKITLKHFTSGNLNGKIDPNEVTK